MSDELTILNGKSGEIDLSHRNLAKKLINELEKEMPEDEYYDEFVFDIRNIVTGSVIEDLSINLKGGEWVPDNFEEPEDILNADKVADVISDMIRYNLKSNPWARSPDIMDVILTYAKEYGIVEERQK